MRLRQHTLDVDGLALSYAEGDFDGAPLVLLHGLAARWQAFGPLIPALSTSWHLIALDLRGHGASGRAGDRYGIDDFAHDVVALLEARADEPAVVYGHSLGGWTGLWVAAHRPDLVRALVVADSAIDPAGIPAEAAISYLADLPITLRSMSKSLKQLDPQVMDAYHEGRLTDGFDAGDLFGRISCPVLLLQASPEHGGLMSDDDVAWALRELTDVRHTRFDALGHGLHVEDAPAVLAAVEPFLSKI